MIGLVFSRDTSPSPAKSRSWWVDAPREAWKCVYRWEALSRLRLQKAIQEPTAKREVPDWQKRWNKAQEPPESYAKPDTARAPEGDES